MTDPAAHYADLLAAVDGGEVYRDINGTLHRQGVVLAEDDADFLTLFIDCPVGRTAHLNEAGHTSAWRVADPDRRNP